MTMHRHRTKTGKKGITVGNSEAAVKEEEEKEEGEGDSCGVIDHENV